MTTTPPDFDALDEKIAATAREFAGLAGVPRLLQLAITTDAGHVYFDVPGPGHPAFDAQTLEVRSAQIMLWLATMRLVLIAKADDDARARAKSN